jgi:3-oxoadipate enol-lactonase
MKRLNFIKEGAGPVIVLSHALGCDLSMWDGVVNLLKNQFTLIRYDHRNHGTSFTELKSFTIDDMADDVSDLIKEIVSEPVCFVGLSLGGMVGQSLAARYPNLMRSLVIANSASYYDDVAKKAWASRIALVRDSGLSSISKMALERWFTPGFLNSPDSGDIQTLENIKTTLEACNALAYIESCNAVLNVDTRMLNRQISMPSLILFGTQDLATPKQMSELISRDIRMSKIEGIEAAHLSAVESPQIFVDKLLNFFN